jgi:hypothetical protein
MIIVQILGGLGNQMFQYAFARALARRMGVELKLDITAFEEYKLRNFELDVFNIDHQIATVEEIAFLRRKRLWGKTFFKEKSLKFNPRFLKCPKKAYFQGYFQSEQYFEDAAEVVRCDFTFKNALSASAQRFADDISSKNAVSLHIRRGDYVQNPTYAVNLDQYYAAAIAHMSKNVGQPEFFVFSDDKEYAARAFGDFTIVETASGVEDMHLMSLCKHNIIANSSFSWWGARLNAHPQKLVAAPNAWFADEKLDSSTIVPKSWTRL